MYASVFCTVAGQDNAEEIVSDLKDAGFSGNDISVLMQDRRGTREFATEQNTKAPEGATTGGVAGMGVGAGLGWLVGIGTLAIPGIGPFIAAGPIMAALGGAAIGGATGGIVGALIGLGIPEVEAKHYDERVREGRALVTVHTEDMAERDRARAIFERHGAEDISTGTGAGLGATRGSTGTNLNTGPRY
ncbi:hypothetical protein [Fulvimonas yonginensis]|uniref:DUF3341 domain-containing protein n=1 Tax=Fulvimonas yonginensis TaxID=1495200 RepID=A0ABU8JC98_9GAMM